MANSTHKRWIRGVALELMLSATELLHRVDGRPRIPLVGGVFKAGDRVLIRRNASGRQGFVGVLVERTIGSKKALRIRRARGSLTNTADELWAYWDYVIGWKRP